MLQIANLKIICTDSTENLSKLRQSFTVTKCFSLYLTVCVWGGGGGGGGGGVNLISIAY